MSNSSILFQILHENQHFIIISKPSGLLSQGEHSGEPNVVDQLRTYWGRPYVGLIHRLDRNTSGVMIIAKRSKAAQRLTDSLQSGRLIRSYLAWVIGELDEPKTWVHHLAKNLKTNFTEVYPIEEKLKNSPSLENEVESEVESEDLNFKLDSVAQPKIKHTVRINNLKTKPAQNGQAQKKRAQLLAKPLEKTILKGFALTLVEFQLETGRSHQIRAQAAYEGYPLLGDTKYQTSNNPISHLQEQPYRLNYPPFPRLALHSFLLKFPHPISQKDLTFIDPLPEELARLKTKNSFQKDQG